MPWREQAGEQLRGLARTPVCPVASVDSRSSISARTTSRSTSGPEPAACERTSDRCSWARISVGMCRVASAPNPVEMPYAGVGAAASSSTTARARSIAARAAGAERHRRPVAGDGHDVLGRERADVDGDRRRMDLRRTWLHPRPPAPGATPAPADRASRIPE